MKPQLPAHAKSDPMQYRPVADPDLQIGEGWGGVGWGGGGHPDPEIRWGPVSKICFWPFGP